MNSHPAACDSELYLTAEVRAIERHSLAQPEAPDLMGRAGLAAAELARDLLGNQGSRVLVFAGPGNNGGDAFVLARYLKQWWYRVAVVFTGDPFKLPEDASKALEAWRQSGGDIHDLVPRERHWDLVVDGLFGIGLTRDLGGQPAEIVTRINSMEVPVLALDVPSGLDADTGRIMGRAVRANHTITFIGLKPGLFTRDGCDLAGEVHLRRLGLAPREIVQPSGMLLHAETLGRILPPRRANSHKGSHGSLGILGGAAGMAGAALLAGRAALKAGAGRVYVGLLDSEAPALDPLQAELMLRGADAVLKLPHLTTLAVGPGMGQSSTAKLLLKNAIKTDLALLLDADALNLLAQEPILRRQVIRRSAPTLLTPHPAEAARLLGATVESVQNHRIEAARQLAQRLRCEVVLKGAGSVCASPDGRWWINRSGNPGLAAAGQGDVLTGLVGALLAQGAAPDHALRAGVFLHGHAADALVERGIGPVGLTASEVIDAVRALLNRPPFAGATRTSRSGGHEPNGHDAERGGA